MSPHTSRDHGIWAGKIGNPDRHLRHFLGLPSLPIFLAAETEKNAHISFSADHWARSTGVGILINSDDHYKADIPSLRHQNI